MKKIIVTLTGPSCSGKSTLEAHLRNRGFVSLVSTTTRAQRAGEVDGLQYHFTDKSTFKRKLAQGAFVESAQFGEHLYGVTRNECERAFATGKPVVVVVEPEGLRQITEVAKKEGWIHISVYVLINPIEQVARFVARASAELERPDSQTTLKSFLDRLNLMMTVEQGWNRAALAEQSHTMLCVFNQDTERLVIDRILRLVEERTPAAPLLAA